jgi:hypothetical protein
MPFFTPCGGSQHVRKNMGIDSSRIGMFPCGDSAERVPLRNSRRISGLRIVGHTRGNPPKLTDDDIQAAKAMLANPDIGVTQIAHRLGISPATLYRHILAARTANTPSV